MPEESVEYRKARQLRQTAQRQSLRFEQNEIRADVARRLHDLIGTLIREQPEGDNLATTESRLVSSMRSSRNAVREALNMLRAEGRMSRQRGVGTQSTERMHFGWIDTLNDGEGPETDHDLLHLAIVEEPPEVLLERFSLEPDERLVILERASRIGSVTKAVRTVYLRVRDLEAVERDTFKGDLYEVLGRLGVEFESAELYVSAESASERMAELLGIAQGAPLLVFENHTVDSSGRLVYLSYGRSRADLVGLVLRKADR